MKRVRRVSTWNGVVSKAGENDWLRRGHGDLHFFQPPFDLDAAEPQITCQVWSVASLEI
jgi:hypothetical protein